MQSNKARVSISQYAQLWIELANRMNDEFFGMDHHALRRGSYQFISKAVIQSETVEKALKDILKFFNLVLDDLPFGANDFNADNSRKIYLNFYADNASLVAGVNFIRLGFEGLILRNPNVDYQYGRRRVGYMEKFKSKTDGKFLIVDIQSEQKRNLPIITCRNDINEETFETRFSYPHAKQEEILKNKKDYIGKYVFITFGERSGITKVPFHIKEVYLL